MKNYEGSSMMQKHGMMKTNERSRKTMKIMEMMQFHASTAFKKRGGLGGGAAPPFANKMTLQNMNDPQGDDLMLVFASIDAGDDLTLVFFFFCKHPWPLKSRGVWRGAAPPICKQNDPRSFPLVQT